MAQQAIANLRIRAPRDFFGGLIMMALAALALWATRDLSGMHGFAFGPGTAPRLFAWLLMAAAAGVTVTGLLVDGPEIEPYAFRGPIFVVVGILAFAAMIRPLGMVAASYATFIIAIMGSREMRWIESVVGAAVMTAFCVGLFVYALQLPFQLWPSF
ncbi:MAG: tripartite tricarboxylate transporter TctB family protein [Pseudolabrys sp.]|nr:tripartite tricarboxylate transporter TctB family protein [Pseudolabrys sp.]